MLNHMRTSHAERWGEVERQRAAAKREETKKQTTLPFGKDLDNAQLWRWLAITTAIRFMPLTSWNNPITCELIRLLSNSKFPAAGITLTSDSIARHTARIVALEVVPAIRELVKASSALAVTTDLWSDVHSRSFIGVTAHVIDGRHVRRLCLDMHRFNGIAPALALSRCSLVCRLLSRLCVRVHPSLSLWQTAIHRRTCRVVSCMCWTCTKPLTSSPALSRTAPARSGGRCS
jgi:hypothetical protein